MNPTEVKEAIAYRRLLALAARITRVEEDTLKQQYPTSAGLARYLDTVSSLRAVPLSVDPISLPEDTEPLLQLPERGALPESYTDYQALRQSAEQNKPLTEGLNKTTDNDH